MVACHLSDNELDQDIRAILNAHNGRWIKTLSARFEKAIAFGQVDPTQSPIHLASLVVCILSGLSHAARNGASYKQLDGTITAFVNVLHR